MGNLRVAAEGPRRGLRRAGGLGTRARLGGEAGGSFTSAWVLAELVVLASPSWAHPHLLPEETLPEPRSPGFLPGGEQWWVQPALSLAFHSSWGRPLPFPLGRFPFVLLPVELSVSGCVCNLGGGLPYT